MSLGSVRPLQGWGAVGAHRGLLSLEEAWTLESPSSDSSSLPGEESEPMLRINSRAGKMIARQEVGCKVCICSTRIQICKKAQL